MRGGPVRFDGTINLTKRMALLLSLLFITGTSQLRAQEMTKPLVPVPGYQWSFPRDHANHSQYSVEWWYYTGHLLPEGGNANDPAAWTHLQLTFFRSRVPGLNSGELYFGHLAMSGGVTGEFDFSERIARGTLGEAGAEETVYHVWLDNWRASEIDGEHFLEAYDPSVGGIRLLATAETDPMLNGSGGYSVKNPDSSEASYYYSLPTMSVKGLLLPPKVDGEDEGIDEAPIRVSGDLWMDHEFGNQMMGTGLTGWDWWGLDLPDGGRLMIYLIRRGDDSPIEQSGGTLLTASGKTHHITLDQIEIETTGQWVSPTSGAEYPHGWNIRVPAHGIELTVTPVRGDQELRTDRSTRVTYYEGAVQVSQAGQPKSSFGFVELVGYNKE